MNVLRQVTAQLRAVGLRLAMAGWLAVLGASTSSTGAEPRSTGAEPRSAGVEPRSTGVAGPVPDRSFQDALAAGRRRPRAMIADVALQPPQGALLGRVVPAADGSPRPAVAGRRVSLWQRGKMLTWTCCDREGRFVFAGLSGGVYRIVVETSGVPAEQVCRAWTFQAAPPSAVGELAVWLDGGVIRGQGPFPFLSSPEAVAVGAVAVGAVAVPIIYHSTRVNNRVPASP